jgi:curved DNA-binding protein CbpA
MASKTLYDILELSSNASDDSIRAAYERLSAKLDPARPENAGKTEVKFKAEAIKEAFLTLANPATRAQYDKTLAARSQPPVEILEEIEPFWTIPKLTVLVLIVIIVGGYYYKHQREETRLAAEKAIATAKAKQAQEQAKAEEVQARLDLAKQQQERIQDEQQRRERDAALRQFSAEQRTTAGSDLARTQRERTEQQQRQREEAQATAAARQQAAREKAELCRLERQRYGRAISC